MKKTITLLSICLITIVGTQTVQAQTKEETISWLKETLAQQVEDIDEKSIRIEPCKISWIEGDTTFKYISYGYPAFACSIDIAKAGSWTVDQQNGRLIAASPSIVSYGYDNHNNVFIEDDSTPYQRLNLISTNERLLSELARALEQLASYCDHEKDSAHEP